VAAPSATELQVPAADRDALVERWLNGLRISHIAHSRAAARCARRGQVLGTAVVVLTSVVGTAIFATLESSPSDAVRIAAGMLSVVAAVFAGLSTFLQYPDRAAAHRAAAGRYGALRRELESARLAADGGWDAAQALAARWNELDETAPDVPQALHDAARAAVVKR
jgi:hypothetical protein